MHQKTLEITQILFSIFSLFGPGDCFVGYHSDTAATVVIQKSEYGYSDFEVRW